MKGEYDLPIYEHKDGLRVVPSCLDLSAVETELMNEAGRELILAHLIKGQKEKFDYILIDCPPSLSLLTLKDVYKRQVIASRRKHGVQDEPSHSPVPVHIGVNIHEKEV